MRTTYVLLAAATLLTLALAPLAYASPSDPISIGTPIPTPTPGSFRVLSYLTAGCPQPVVPWVECMAGPVIVEVVYIVDLGITATFYIVNGVYYAFETVCDGVLGSCPFIAIAPGQIIDLQA